MMLGGVVSFEQEIKKDMDRIIKMIIRRMAGLQI
jgi:hypothetical protein